MARARTLMALTKLNREERKIEGKGSERGRRRTGRHNEGIDMLIRDRGGSHVSLDCARHHFVRVRTHGRHRACTHAHGRGHAKYRAMARSRCAYITCARRVAYSMGVTRAPKKGEMGRRYWELSREKGRRGREGGGV